MHSATKVILPDREVIICHDMPDMGKGLPYRVLHESAVGGYPVWLAESDRNFRNPMAQSSQKRYDEMGFWVEITADKIPAQAGRLVGDKLELTYVSDAGTEFEKEHKVLAPRCERYYVPTQDGMFHEGTLIPLKTTNDREEAVRRWEHAGLDPNYLSRFFRLDDYTGKERYVCRFFDADERDFGRFYVDAYGHPSDFGIGRVAARRRVITPETPEVVMEVDLRSEK